MPKTFPERFTRPESFAARVFLCPPSDNNLSMPFLNKYLPDFFPSFNEQNVENFSHLCYNYPDIVSSSQFSTLGSGNFSDFCSAFSFQLFHRGPFSLFLCPKTAADAFLRPFWHFSVSSSTSLHDFSTPARRKFSPLKTLSRPEEKIGKTRAERRRPPAFFFCISRFPPSRHRLYSQV